MHEPLGWGRCGNRSRRGPKMRRKSVKGVALEPTTLLLRDGTNDIFGKAVVLVRAVHDYARVVAAAFLAVGKSELEKSGLDVELALRGVVVDELFPKKCLAWANTQGGTPRPVDGSTTQANAREPAYFISMRPCQLS